MTDERQAGLRARELPAVLEWMATDMEYAARRGTEDEDLKRWRAAVREVRAALAVAQVPAREPFRNASWAEAVIDSWSPDERSRAVEARARELAGPNHRHGAIPARFWREAAAALTARVPAQEERLRDAVEDILRNPATYHDVGSIHGRLRRALGVESKEEGA